MILLDCLKQVSGDKALLYPDYHGATKVISEDRVNNALLVMGYDTKNEVCGHGYKYRSTARYDIECQLSYSERNNARTAYIHSSEHLVDRRSMIQW